jgi:hypothetical protein
MWDTPALEPNPRHRSGFLFGADYHYATPLAAVQRAHPLPPPVREEVPIYDFQSSELSEEEALQKATKESELLELSQWEGLPVLLREPAILQGRLMTPPRTPRQGRAPPLD